MKKLKFCQYNTKLMRYRLYPNLTCPNPTEGATENISGLHH